MYCSCAMMHTVFYIYKATCMWIESLHNCYGNGIDLNFNTLEVLWRSLEVLWRVFGATLESLWRCFGVSLDMLWRVFGDALESLWRCFGVFGAALECLWSCFGYSKVSQISLGKSYLSQSALRQTWALLIFNVFSVSRAT